MDLQLLIAQWSGALPPRLVRTGLIPEVRSQCVQPRCKHPVGTKKNGELARSCDRSLERRARSYKTSQGRIGSRLWRQPIGDRASGHSTRTNSLPLLATHSLFRLFTRNASTQCTPRYAVLSQRVADPDAPFSKPPRRWRLALASRPEFTTCQTTRNVGGSPYA